MRRRPLHALMGNIVLLGLLIVAVAATGGVDWWPVR